MAYELIKHAATLAVQLEAAGLPEAHTSAVLTIPGFVVFEWRRLDPLFRFIQTTLVVAPTGIVRVHCEYALPYDLRVGDPLPAELIAAIRATAT